MTPTIDDIAKRAGVSAGTVSRVLNGRNKENRPAIARRAERIRKIAREMGYRPNAAARSIVSGKFNLVAFLTCGDPGFDWFPAGLMHGAQAGLADIGSRLVVNELPGRRFSEPDFVPTLLQESAVDGLLIHIDGKLPDIVVPYFESQPFASVVMNLRRPVRSVYPDEISGGRLAVEHLVAQGHERIGYLRAIASEGWRHYSMKDRLEGFRRGMRWAGLDARAVRVERKPSVSNANGLANAEAFLEDFPDLTAVICYTQEDAVLLSIAATRSGRRVPDDLAIACFGEAPNDVSANLGLETVLTPFSQVGVQAVRMLSDMIKKGIKGPKSVAVPYEWVAPADVRGKLRDPMDS